MSFLAWIASALGLVPQAIEAGKKIAEAVKPTPKIDKANAVLWHTVTYGRGLRFCTVCQQYVDTAAELCPEQVRRRQLI